MPVSAHAGKQHFPFKACRFCALIATAQFAKGLTKLRFPTSVFTEPKMWFCRVLSLLSTRRIGHHQQFSVESAKLVILPLWK